VGSEPRRCEICVRGPLGPTMTQPPARRWPRGETLRTHCLIGPFQNHRAPYGVMHQLEPSGLQLLKIRPPPIGDPGRPTR
jgi:hypothetical protein